MDEQNTAVPLFTTRSVIDKPHPWTAAKVVAAKAMVDELSGLDDAEKVLLKASIDDSPPTRR
jgi:Uncharacterized protein conserved in bacteria (DUF2321)